MSPKFSTGDACTYGGKTGRIIAMGSLSYAALVEFEDGTKKIVRRRTLRKVRTTAKK